MFRPGRTLEHEENPFPVFCFQRELARIPGRSPPGEAHVVEAEEAVEAVVFKGR